MIQIISGDKKCKIVQMMQRMQHVWKNSGTWQGAGSGRNRPGDDKLRCSRGVGAGEVCYASQQDRLFALRTKFDLIFIRS